MAIVTSLLSAALLVQYVLLSVMVLRVRPLWSRPEMRIGASAALLFFLGAMASRLLTVIHGAPTTARGQIAVTTLIEVIGGYVALYVAWKYLDVRVVSKRRVQEAQERRRQEAELAALRRMDALGRLARGIIHDYNHILAAVKGFATFIERDIEAVKGEACYTSIRESLAAIREATDQADALTQQVADFSRSGATEPMETSVKRAVDSASRLLASAEIDVNIAMDLDEDDTVMIERGGIRQVLLNLAFNARDAMPEGGLLCVKGFRVGEDSICLRVTDTGEGMDDETRRHIFEPYYTTKPKGQGTGLGLSTVYGIVTKAGGSIRVSSDTDGTDVVILLPRADRRASS